jgi:hypothetical protein
MEWQILLSLAVVVLVIGVLSRLRRSRRREPEEETKNIYPLW